MTPVVSTVRELRTTLLSWREAGESVALVPTMGALHRGHLALVSAAKRVAKRCVVSIFVNPIQFGPKEDFSSYPRQLEQDQKSLTDANCDLLFAPTATDMYQDGFASRLNPGPLGEVLEGAFRPGFFTGVATVVVKLLLQALPDSALFGEKDFQQLLIIRNVVKDLNIPVHILGVPTVRDEDGLALSSRNVYLSPEERRRAVCLPQTMVATAKKIMAEQSIPQALEVARRQIQNQGIVLDYFDLIEPNGLRPLLGSNTDGPLSGARLVLAARVGTTRLIDNMAIDSPIELK